MNETWGHYSEHCFIYLLNMFFVDDFWFISLYCMVFIVVVSILA
jgi:hypothetical protein